MNPAKVIPIHNYHDKLQIIFLLDRCKGNSIAHYYIQTQIAKPECIDLLIAELKADCENERKVMVGILGENLVCALLKYTP